MNEYLQLVGRGRGPHKREFRFEGLFWKKKENGLVTGCDEKIDMPPRKRCLGET